MDLVPTSWLKGIDTAKISKHNLAARALANEVCPGFELLEKDKYGKPYFESANHYISLSHSGKFAAFMLNKDDECGIDMEQITDRIHRIAPKFMREDESGYQQQGTKGLYTVWCAKEALYKYYGLKALDFRQHLKVESKELGSEGELKGYIEKGNYAKEVGLSYWFIEDYIIVHTL